MQGELMLCACYVVCSSSVVECPFAAVSKIGHFRSLHDAPVHSAI